MKKLGKKALWMAVACGCCYLYFAMLLQFTCKDILCFQEGLCAFISEWSLVWNVIAEPGGLAKLSALWVMQWMTGPIEAVLVGAWLFMGMTMVVVWIAKRLGCGLWQLALMAVPTTALLLMSCNIDYSQSGTMAYAFMLVCILALTFIRKDIVRLAVSTVGCFFVAWIGGAIVMLYALVVLNIELLRNWKRGWRYVLLPVIAYIIGVIEVEMGYCRDIERVLLPYAYYARWSSTEGMSLLPWVMTIAVINATAVLGQLRRGKGPIYQAVLSVLILGAFVFNGMQDNSNQENRALARLSYLSGKRDWSQIMAEYKEMPQEDFTLQNIANMALAERGMLCDAMFQHYNFGVSSLHNSQDKSPYIYMVLSDVYYSMGLIALAQKFAFEANESFGNYSPRMLKRLVDTNIISGQYDVASKYISLLERTSHYADWVRQRRMIVDGKAGLDSELAAKRGCIFPDNRFAGEKGIDNDLLQVLRANNTHRPTMQYLCAYYMLSKNVPQLMSVIEEFYGSEALKSPLPTYLQEAVAVDAIVNGTDMANRYQIEPNVIQGCKAFWSSNQQLPNSLWHYLRYARAAQNEI